MSSSVHHNYLLLPLAKILYWVLIIMEQSTPHTTLWASNSPGKHTCCGELWVSWVPSPRRPSRQMNRNENKDTAAKQFDESWFYNIQNEHQEMDAKTHLKTTGLNYYHCLLFPMQILLFHWSQQAHGKHHMTAEPARSRGVPRLSWAEEKNENHDCNVEATDVKGCSILDDPFFLKVKMSKYILMRLYENQKYTSSSQLTIYTKLKEIL